MTHRKLIEQMVAAIEAIPEDVEGHMPESLTESLQAAREYLAAPEVEPNKCAQCKKTYRYGVSTKGCPKCAAGASVSEAEFQEPLQTHPAPKQED